MRIPPPEIAQARHELVAPTRTMGVGVWEPPTIGDPGVVGFLLIEGVLARDVMLAGMTCTELLGEGDVLKPLGSSADDALVHYHVRWHVLQPVRIAVLDEGLARKLAQWPQVTTMLLERALRRSLRMSIHQALLQLSPVETRLVVLFWHLAERWGRVTPRGISLKLHLSHQVLGQLVGCQRASVTTALGHVESKGLLSRSDKGDWLLHGKPPDELAQLNWMHQGRNGSAAHAAAVAS